MVFLFFVKYSSGSINVSRYAKRYMSYFVRSILYITYQYVCTMNFFLKIYKVPINYGLHFLDTNKNNPFIRLFFKEHLIHFIKCIVLILETK